MLKKLLLIILVAVLASVSSFAKREYQVGLGYSTISSGILSVLVEIDEPYYLVINGMPYYFGDNPPDDMKMYLTGGAELHYDVNRDYYSSLFLFAGASYMYVEDRKTEIVKVNDLENKLVRKNVDQIYNLGAGVGTEWYVLEKLSISVTLGVQYQYSASPQRINKIFDISQNGTNYIGPGGGIAFRYVFR